MQKQPISQMGGVKVADEDDISNDGNEQEKEDDVDEEKDDDDTSDSDKSEGESEQDEPVEPDNADEKEDEEPSKFKAGDDDGDNDEQYDDSCLYNIKRKIDTKILESDEFDDDLFGDDKVVQTKRLVKPEERITKPILTKYERVRLLSERRKQLVLGAKPMIRVSNKISEKDIASLELKAKVIPLIIVRTLPNGDIEHWKMEELAIVN